MNLEQGEKDKALKTDNADLKARLERPLLGEMKAGRFTASETDNTVHNRPPGGKEDKRLRIFSAAASAPFKGTSGQLGSFSSSRSR